MKKNIISKEQIMAESVMGYIRLETWDKTFDFRYANKSIPIDENIGKWELRLQQKSISDMGNEKWEWIPEYTENINDILTQWEKN